MMNTPPDNKELPPVNSDQVTVNFNALGAALFELSEINTFIADMSRILQQESLMDDEKG